MDGWKKWIGKKVFIRTKNGRFYSGVVTEVLDNGDALIFITILDKFSKYVCFASSEIIEIKEEN
jgi:small nuclear ribonucleoprotein (snRNP)-like protein